MRNELVLCRQRSANEPIVADPTIRLSVPKETTTMNPMEHAMLSSITLFWKTYKIGLVDPVVGEVSEGPLCEWRIHLTRNINQRGVHQVSPSNSQWTIDTRIGKALHLRNAFRTHIETLYILLDRVPEMTRLEPQTRRALVDGAWLCLKFLRGVPNCERIWSKSDLQYNGLSGKKYGLEFFTAAGMSLCMLMKVVKTTGRIQQLKPDNEELSLLASIALFTPTRRGITNSDDMAFLETIQRTMVTTLEKKLYRDPERITLFKDFLMGLAELRTLGHEHLGDYNQFVNFQPKIVMHNGGGGALHQGHDTR